MLDAHIHLHESVFSRDLPLLLERAREAGIEGWLSCPVDWPSWERTLFLSKEFPGIMPAFGIHPWNAEQRLPESEKLRTALEKCLAIGEIGLDSRCGVPFELQLERFREQLKLAEEIGRPVVIHARCPWDIMLGELCNFHGRGLIHNYTGSREIADHLIDAGFLLSFGTALLRTAGKKLIRTAASLPLEYIVLETDAPAMPFENELNVPENLLRVVSAFARLRGIPAGDLGKTAADNLRTLLGV